MEEFINIRKPFGDEATDIIFTDKRMLFKY